MCRTVPKFIAILICTTVLLSNPQVLWAKVQRIALPRLNGLSLGPAGSKVGGNGGDSFRHIPAICLNPDRDSPRKGNSLKYLVSSADQGTVKIGDRMYSLAQALAEEKISLEGSGDHTDLVIRNNTTEAAVIDVPEPFAVSTSDADHLKDFPDLKEVFKDLTERTLEVALHDLQDHAWELYENRQVGRDLSLLKGELSAKEYNSFDPEQTQVIALHDDPEVARIAVLHGLEGYEVAWIEDGEVIREPFDPGRELPELPASFSRRMALVAPLIERAEFDKVASASTAATQFLAFGPGFALDGDTSCRLGNLDARASAVALRSLSLDAGMVPDSMRALIEQSGARRIILWRSHYQRFSLDEEEVDWGKLVERLQKEFPDREFALDGDDPRSRTKMEDQLPVRGDDDLAVYNDENSLPPAYKNMISKLKNRFEENQVQVSSPGDEGLVEARNALVISGYKNEEFQRLALTLLDEGKFKNKIVVFLSCGEGQEVDFNSMLLASPDGPRAILYYTERISPRAVQRLLTRLSELLDARVGKPDHGRIQDLIRRAIDLEVRDAEAEGLEGEFIDHLHQLKRLILQLSRIEAACSHALIAA